MVKNPPSNAGDVGLIPSPGTKTPHATGRLSPHTTAREASSLWNRAPRQEKPAHYKKDPAQSPQKYCITSPQNAPPPLPSLPARPHYLSPRACLLRTLHVDAVTQSVVFLSLAPFTGQSVFQVHLACVRALFLLGEDKPIIWTFLVAQMVRNLPAMQKTRVQSLGWEDPLEKGMATHSSILTWRIPRTQEPGGLQSMGSQRVGHD